MGFDVPSPDALRGQRLDVVIKFLIEELRKAPPDGKMMISRTMIYLCAHAAQVNHLDLQYLVELFRAQGWICTIKPLGLDMKAPTDYLLTIKEKP